MSTKWSPGGVMTAPHRCPECNNITRGSGISDLCPTCEHYSTVEPATAWGRRLTTLAYGAQVVLLFVGVLAVLYVLVVIAYTRALGL